MANPLKRLWDSADRALGMSPYEELDPIERLRNRLVDKLPEGIQAPFRSGPYHLQRVLEDPREFLEKGGEFLDRASGSRGLRRGIGFEPGPEGKYLPIMPSMGTEILGERGAPYQDIGEQHRMNEAIIRLLMQEGNPPEYGGPITQGAPLPAAPGPYGHGVPADNQPTPGSALEALEMRNLPRGPSRETGWEFDPY